jgi:hypothetical protein
MAEEKMWVVTLSSGRPAGEVRKDLADAGFAVDQVLDEIGVITGRCDDSVAGRVRAIEGVADIAGDTPIDIGPPGSPDTW